MTTEIQVHDIDDIYSFFNVFGRYYLLQMLMIIIGNTLGSMSYCAYIFAAQPEIYR